MTFIEPLPMAALAGGVALMCWLLCWAIGQASHALAAGLIEDRRTREQALRSQRAAAEAAGRAAAIEPLALNADGSVEEPILGVVERP